MAASKIHIFNSLASDYDTWFEEEGRLIFASEVEALRQILPSLSRPWIEVGVGSGRFAQKLSIDIGLDPSVKLLEIARNRGLNLLLGRGEEMPIHDGVFGAIFFIVTLCFVDSPQRILDEANRILRSEGKVVLGLVLKESSWGEVYQAEKQRGHRFYSHATFYSYADVAMLLEQTGFYIENVVSTLLQNPGEVYHIESPQRGFSQSAGFTVVLASKRRSR